MDAGIATTITTGIVVGGFLWQRTADLKNSLSKRIDDTNKRIDDLKESLNKRIDDLRSDRSGKV